MSIIQVGNVIMYVNADGTTAPVVAESATEVCVGCVGEGTNDGSDRSVCERLPNCGGIIWKEAVS